MPESETKTKEPEGNLPDPVMDVLKDLKERVENLKPAEEKKPETVPVDLSRQQREEEKKALGFTEEQMQAHERSIARAQAPVVEQSAWTTLERKPDIDTYRKEIQEELRIYSPERRTPDIMEKIYYMVKGKHADSKPMTKEITKPSGVEQTRISRGPGYTGNEPGLSSGKQESGKDDVELDDREKFVAAKLGVDLKDYAQSKKVGKEIRELKIPDTRPASSLADVELKRLMNHR